MEHLKKNNISWYFEDHEDLSAISGQLLEENKKRRSYFTFEHEGRAIFIKYFLEKGVIGKVRNVLFARGKKEYTIGKKLLSFSISTPKPLGYGVGKTGSFILQEYVNGITYLSDYNSAPNKDILLNVLARFLAQFRDHHVRHNDLHLENILVIGQELCVIDLHKTVIRTNQLSRSDEISNLTHSLAMIYTSMNHSQKHRFFEIYGNATIRNVVEKSIDSQWYRWISRKEKRAFCKTSLVNVVGQRVYMRGEEGKGTGELVDVLKTDKKVIIERYNDHIRKIYTHTRRAKKAWRNVVVLNYLSLPIIPRPYFIQRKHLRQHSYIAMEDLSGRGIELDRFLDREYDSLDKVQRIALAKKLAHFFMIMLEKGVIHVDLKACNVFVLNDHFVLLDYEDFLFHRPEEKDIERLMWQLLISTPSRIASFDRIMFFKTVLNAFPFNKKEMHKRLRNRSINASVVYEGASGLKTEVLEWSSKDRQKL